MLFFFCIVRKVCVGFVLHKKKMLDQNTIHRLSFTSYFTIQVIRRYKTSFICICAYFYFYDSEHDLPPQSISITNEI